MKNKLDSRVLPKGLLILFVFILSCFSHCTQSNKDEGTIVKIDISKKETQLKNISMVNLSSILVNVFMAVYGLRCWKTENFIIR